jgi:hypothetical protein
MTLRVPPMPEPVRLIAPPSPDELAAEKDARAAALRVRLKRQEMCREKAVRRTNCGHGRPRLIRREDHRAVMDAMIRFTCGRSDCAYCWRLRLLKTIRRATRRLLRVDGKARLGKLYCCEINWPERGSLNRKLRRHHGKQCGRLHLRTCDNRALVIAEVPIPGGDELTPGQAVVRILDAIDHMHKDRSAFRLLGRWSDHKESGWELKETYNQSFDLQLIRDELARLRKKSTWGWERYPEVQQGLLWQSCTVEDADDIIRQLKAACHFMTIEEPASTGRKSDRPPSGGRTAPGFSPDDTPTPFDTEQDEGEV